MNHGSKQNPILRVVKKFFYSAFVTVTFILYALENRGTNALTSISSTNITAPPSSGFTASQGETSTNTAPTSPAGTASAAASGTATSSAAAAPIPAATATNVPTATSQPPAPTSTSGYQDGTYTGPQVNIRWGYVQVQATIQGGQVANIKVVQYPTERRTSARINSIAVPELQQEAIQAQSANVNIITGATLTSEGFQMSLQAALSQAKG